MKLVFICLLLLAANGTCFAQNGNTALFDYFESKGKDARFEKEIDHQKHYFKPILSGFYPDPSICRKGDTYYLVTSSFSFYPGIPIFSSKDVVNCNSG